MTRRKKAEHPSPAPVRPPKRYLWDCLDKRYYDPPPPDVRRPSKPSLPQWRREQSTSEHLADVKAYEATCATYEQEKAAYDAAMEAHNEVVSQREAEFKEDLFDYLDIKDNPKRNLLFSIAWEGKHSYGRNDVVSFAGDLVPLIKE